jgi:hypothetical protein
MDAFGLAGHAAKIRVVLSESKFAMANPVASEER